MSETFDQWRHAKYADRDLRRAPKGETREWKIERLILRRGRKRRTRETLEIAFCADGWHSASGSADEPYGDAICNTLLDRSSTRTLEEFDAFHEEHPVVWRVTRHEGRWTIWGWYCAPEFPEEYAALLEESQAPEER